MTINLYKSLLVATFAMSMAACSSMPAPKTEMALSDSAIQDAELAGAREYAPLELRRANEKLDEARKAMQDEEYELAKRKAEQAKVDAELAEAKSYSAKSKVAIRELRESIDLMRDEISRAQGS